MGLQRLVWNNKVPFEMRAIRAMPDGFEIEFTKPVDKKVAADIASYSVESYIYKYHGVYGSPPVNTAKCPIMGVKVSEDGLKARLIVNNLRKYYIHTITLNGIRDKENYFNLVHPIAYYTLNNIPEGQKLSMAGVSTIDSKKVTKSANIKKGSSVKTAASASKTTVTANAIPTFEEVKPLLAKNTCLSCHNAYKRQVGPAYVDVAKRKYSVNELIQLIHNPKPEHWPDYSTPMPPMPQVPVQEARKIALWIRSLAK
jgi:cytochrome c551/c552